MTHHLPASNVLPFPKRNHGRVRRSNSFAAAGYLSLYQVARLCEPVPDNVRRIDRLDREEPELDNEPGIFLAGAIFQLLPLGEQGKIERTARNFAICEGDRTAWAVMNLIAAWRRRHFARLGGVT